MRIFFVDRVVRLEKDRYLEATLSLPPDEPIFAVHFPGNPMLPASMMIECLAQAGSILLEASSGFTLKAIPGFVREAKFRRAVRPGASLRIFVDAEQRSEDAALLRGRVVQGVGTTAVGTLGMVTAPLSDFYRREDAAAFRDMYTRWLESAETAGFEGSVLDPLRHALVR